MARRSTCSALALLACFVIFQDSYFTPEAVTSPGLEQEIRVVTCSDESRVRVYVEGRLVRHLLGEDTEVVSEWHERTRGYWYLVDDKLEQWAKPSGPEVEEP